MMRSRLAEHKPLSFSTTMRNPMRIAGFLNCLLPFENMILTSDVIKKIIRDVLNKKLYCTNFQSRDSRLKEIYNSDELVYNSSDLDYIITNSPQKHKEAGFNHGWDSRFDTWYKLSMEFGFVYYEIGKPILISNTGHMLIDAFNEIPINEQKIQNVMLNALMKYQTNNPFRKNKNSNAPMPLLLQVLDLLKNDPAENNAGLYRQELPILICWNNNNAEEIYNYIKIFRQENGYNYSDEFIYGKCLEILGAKSHRKRFKMKQICGEAVDEYIRKMRSTGIISLRGNGRFIDFNMLEEDKIRYVIDNYSHYPIFTDKQAFYQYMGTIDNTILEIKKSDNIDLDDAKKSTLYKYAQEYTHEKIFNELQKVCNKKESTDKIFKFINAPTRLEFLISISLVQQFKDLDVSPNYSVDDEGLPTFTAGGGIADIICYDDKYHTLVEVTLLRGCQDQVCKEMIPISRHLSEYKKSNKNSFSIFVAPIIRSDTKIYVDWIKSKENLDIITFNISDYINTIKESNNISNLL